MTDEGLPTPIKLFLEAYITSVEQLEILLLLEANPAQDYRVQAVYDVILSTKPSVEAWLERFVDQRLVRKLPSAPPAYRFEPEKAELGATIAAVAKAYQEMPVRVIEAIYRRQRGAAGPDPAQGFADAFKFRKD